MNPLASTIDEIEWALEQELLEFDALKARVEALRSEADELWASRLPRIETIEALQKVFALFNGGIDHPTRASGAPTVPVFLDDPIDDCTPGHTTVIDVGAVAQTVVPPAGIMAVAEALQQYGKAIGIQGLTTIVQHAHPAIASGSIRVYLGQLHHDGLVDRPSKGVYVWVGDKEANDA